MSDGGNRELGLLLEEARRRAASGKPAGEVVDMVWFEMRFHTDLPLYHEGLLALAREIWERRETGGPDAVPHCMLLLGRTFDARCELLPACRFYRVARDLFIAEEGIIAMEFFREQLRSQRGKEQVGLEKAEFEARYRGDTPDRLMRTYVGGEGGEG